MGKNTPERKDYIMENLVVPVEEQDAQREVPSSKLQFSGSLAGGATRVLFLST